MHDCLALLGPYLPSGGLPLANVVGEVLYRLGMHDVVVDPYIKLRLDFNRQFGHAYRVYSNVGQPIRQLGATPKFGCEIL